MHQGGSLGRNRRGCLGERRLLWGLSGQRVYCCPSVAPFLAGFLERIGGCYFPLAAPALLFMGLLSQRRGSRRGNNGLCLQLDGDGPRGLSGFSCQGGRGVWRVTAWSGGSVTSRQDAARRQGSFLSIDTASSKPLSTPLHRRDLPPRCLGTTGKGQVQARFAS